MHHGAGLGNGAHGGGSWYTLDDTKKVTRKNGEADYLGTGTHGHDAYVIQLLDPDIDQYDIYYQINNGLKQKVEIRRVSD